MMMGGYGSYNLNFKTYLYVKQSQLRASGDVFNRFVTDLTGALQAKFQQLWAVPNVNKSIIDRCKSLAGRNHFFLQIVKLDVVTHLPRSMSIQSVAM